MTEDVAETLGGRRASLVLRAYLGLAILFLMAPIIAVTVGSLTTTQYVVFPPRGLTLQWYLRMFERPEMLTSFLLSLGIAAAAASVATVIALLSSLVIVRFRTALNAVLWFLVVSPMMLPATVLGFATLQSYTSLGIGTSVTGLLAGHIVLVTPYAVALVTAGLKSIDIRLEEAARSLGASPARALIHVTIPLMAWSLAAGWVMAFLVSLGDAAISVFLNTPEVVTLPVRIFDALRYSPLNPQLTALSSVLVLITIIVLFLFAAFVKPEKLLRK